MKLLRLLALSIFLTIPSIYLGTKANQSHFITCDAYTGATEEIQSPPKRTKTVRSDRKRHTQHGKISSEAKNNGSCALADSLNKGDFLQDSIKTTDKK